ncbi:MAG TPA: 5-formyltetrahydrofolate cyclo-ligase, partial [Candidatus Omnitrophica bacterium]|nr:5-formyltetrahydrofolate cyclo-ligase [Candidatus Omnitrophota bacterium]
SKSYEVDTWTIIKQALETGKKVAVPYVLKGDRFIIPSLIVDKEELIKGPYGVYQPHPDNVRAVDLNQLDIVLVPGIAFDRKGNRLGHGKGYYDRFIKKIPYAYTLGLAYDFQILEALPVSEEDRPVSSLVCG